MAKECKMDTPPRWTSVDAVKLIVVQNKDGSSVLRYQFIGQQLMSVPGQSEEATPTAVSSSFIPDPPAGAEEMLGLAEATAPSEDTIKRIEEQYGHDKVKLTFGNGRSIYDLLQQLAELGNMNIVSPYYTHCKIIAVSSKITKSDGWPAEYCLKTIAGVLRASVEKQDDLRILDSSQWFNYRAREIPQRLVSKWHKVRKQQGYLGIKEAVEIAQLSDEQLKDLSLYGFSHAYAIAENKPILMLVAGLNADQYSAIFSDRGLPVRSLTDEQKTYIAQWTNNDDSTGLVSSERPEASEISSLAIRISPAQAGDGKGKRSYELEIHYGLEGAMATSLLEESANSGNDKTPTEPVCEITVEPVTAH
jgi:hypothetical protein